MRPEDAWYEKDFVFSRADSHQREQRMRKEFFQVLGRIEVLQQNDHGGYVGLTILRTYVDLRGITLIVCGSHDVPIVGGTHHVP